MFTINENWDAISICDCCDVKVSAVQKIRSNPITSSVSNSPLYKNIAAWSHCSGCVRDLQPDTPSDGRGSSAGLRSPWYLSMRPGLTVTAFTEDVLLSVGCVCWWRNYGRKWTICAAFLRMRDWYVVLIKGYSLKLPLPWRYSHWSQTPWIY